MDYRFQRISSESVFETEEESSTLRTEQKNAVGRCHPGNLNTIIEIISAALNRTRKGDLGTPKSAPASQFFLPLRMARHSGREPGSRSLPPFCPPCKA